MITSDQIHEKQFSYKMRGYNEAEVDEYLDSLASYIDTLSKENRELKERLKSTTDQLTYMKNLETTLRDTLVTAQRSAEETLQNANQKADDIVANANAEGENIIKAANREADGVRRQIASLQQQASVYRQNFTMLLNSQMQILEDSGIGKTKPGDSVASSPRSSMQRITLTETESDTRVIKPTPRKIVPIPTDDEEE